MELIIDGSDEWWWTPKTVDSLTGWETAEILQTSAQEREEALGKAQEDDGIQKALLLGPGSKPIISESTGIHYRSF
jgi:hypothetical protein